MTNESQDIPEVAPEIPSPEPATPQMNVRRSVFAWIVLWSLFGLMVLGQLAVYLVPAETPAKPAEPSLITELRSMMMQQRMMEVMTQREDPENYARNLAKTREKATVRPPTSESKARLGVLIDREMDKPADPADVAFLEKSKEAKDKAFLELLRTGKTTHDTKGLDALERRIATAYGEGKKGADIRNMIYPDAAVGQVMAGFAVLIAALGLGFILLVYGGIRYAQGDWKPLRYPDPPPSKVQSDALAGRMVGYFLIFILVSTSVAVMPDGLDSTVAIVVMMLGILALFVASFGIPLFGQRIPFRNVLGRTKGVCKLVGLGALGWMANLPLALGFAVVGVTIFSFLPAPSHPVVSDLANANSPLQILALFLATAVIVPIHEELAFRGTLFPGLLPYMKPFAAMVISALLFASIHPQGPSLWLSLASVGTMAAFLTYQSGSLIPAISMHAIHNFSLLMINRLVT